MNDPNDAYVPSFWIFNGGSMKTSIEPLIPSWHSHVNTTLVPDLGFLMTYALVPRILSLQGEMRWDDPKLPRRDIVVSQPHSAYHWGNAKRAFVEIEREYLQDYASLRQMGIAMFFWEKRIVQNDDELSELLGDDECYTKSLPGAMIRCSRLPSSGTPMCAQICGHHLLIQPGGFPISKADEGVGELEWPGLQEGVSKQNYRKYRPTDFVYVDDRVLGEYEGRSDYSIMPEHGSVDYRGQWSVSYCDRFGRDVIRLEVKKLYEGNPPSVIRHWHSYAVAPPTRYERGPSQHAEHWSKSASTG